MTVRPPGGPRVLRVGFVALTDAAPVVMGVEGGVYRDAGLTVEPVRMPSWPAVRDALLDGRLDAAHCLSTLPLSVAAGVTGRGDERLPIVMILNTGGQAVTLGRHLAGPGYADGAAAVRAAAASRRLTFAMTYPGGTHDLLLRTWLTAAGVDPRGVEVIPIPPPQMVANLRGGTMDGFAAGEPWNAVAAHGGIGVTAARSVDVDPGRPEKALVVNARVLGTRRPEVVALVAATLDVCRRLDEPGPRRAAARVLAGRRYVNVPAALIEERLCGPRPRRGDPPAGDHGPGEVRFHDGGAVNVPRRGDALLALERMAASGMVGPGTDPHRIADRLIRTDVYREAAAAAGVAVPDGPARALTG